MNNSHTAIKSLLSITPSGYNVFYAPLYLNLSHWIEKNVPDLSLEVKAKRLETIWRYGADALKIRRGYLLPFGSDAETCYREQEIWSYAVFTAALFNSVTKHFDPDMTDLIPAILPEPGLAWLKAYSSVFEAWNHYVENQGKNTFFSTLEKQLEKSRKHTVNRS